MKLFSFSLTALVLFSINGYATSPKKTIVVVLGGMGSDGATLNPTPTEHSTKDAMAVYHALQIAPDHNGSKTVGLDFDGDTIGLKCKEPSTGLHTQTAGCEYMTLVKEVAPKNGASIETNGRVEFLPGLSEMIFESLKTADRSRVGAITKTAGNLSCTHAVRPGAKPTCTIEDVTVNKMSINQFPEEYQKEIKKLAVKLGL